MLEKITITLADKGYDVKLEERSDAYFKKASKKDVREFISKLK